MPSEIPNQAKIALQQGRKIEAIKIASQSLNIGLKESKDLIEGHIEVNPGTYPIVNLGGESVYGGLLS